MFLNLGLGRMGCLAGTLAAAGPALDLNFIDGSAFSSLVTFTRTTPATQFYSDGKRDWAPENLCLYGSDFTNAVWVKRGTCAVVANDATAPDGTTTADKITFAGAGNDFYLSGVTIPSGTLISPSFYFKKQTASGTFVVQSANAPSSGEWFVDLALLG